MKNDSSIEATKTTLDVLVQQQMGAVIFVQDYLQLDFDGYRLTLNVWPKVLLPVNTFGFNDSGYRDALCSLISKKIIAVSELATEIVLAFDEGQISVDLSEDIGIEHMIFENTLTNAWSWW